QKHPLPGAYLYNNFTLFQTLTQRGHFRLAKRGQYHWYIHRKNKKLKNHHFAYMWDILNNKTPLGEQAKKYVRMNLDFLKRMGFK
ncbi:hypothetical protein, partial [Mucilaginibacter sp. 22184]|uniref:hypothetical protein n=1 Tax=Mucilaginibacter sp. 22184 TaxID=3453887 RepID=UPI003F85F721